MANTFTNLVTATYKSLDEVSREQVGMIPAVTIDATANAAAVGQSVTTHVVPSSNTGGDTAPAMAFPAAAYQTIGNESVIITKSKYKDFSWQGNEQDYLNNGGAGYDGIRNNQITQAIRSLVNLVEADLCGLHTTASRAYGTATTTPFGTAGDFTDATQALRILKDNGAPLTDNHLIVDTAAGANLGGKQSNSSVEFQDSLLRQGVFRTISGMDIRESGQILTPTAGAMASATSTAAAFTVGQTVIPLATAGTGVVAAGDVITFANDTNKYVVASVTFAGANPAAGDQIVLAEPGLRKAQGAATRAITVIATAARNMCFNRSAIILATRLPEMPQEGDMGVHEVITDPRSGLSLRLSMYKGLQMVTYRVSLAWGVKNIKPAHTAILLG